MTEPAYSELRQCWAERTEQFPTDCKTVTVLTAGFSHLYASYFPLQFLPLYSFIRLFTVFILPFMCASSPDSLFLSILSLSLSKCFGELLFADECIRFLLSPSLPLCFRFSLSLSRRRGVLFLIKASAPELTRQATKSHHHHHHPWEPINNSACCPMHHYAWRFQLSPGQSEHSHTQEMELFTEDQ